ncbi:uncharacterized protein LOC126990941, partial [Eriocheir sinensis]|uniref:uncharacterized protein LOC126990941 n=1 Tax=Eriocheir sinensis TaxID=95602 RepID=UPI0021C9FB49
MRIQELQSKLPELRTKFRETEERWNKANISATLKDTIDSMLKNIIDQHRSSTTRSNQRKLINLNGGELKQTRPVKGYINLSDKTLTPDQEELLNFGLNCHVMTKPRKHQKRVECEILLDDIANLAKQDEVTVQPTFQQEVVAEASKSRGNYKSKIVEERHIEAAKQLKADHNITVRKADKSASYVITNTSEYMDKMDDILKDETNLTSAADFLDILKSNNAKENIASLDVESLFTNVPVDRAIEYILQRVYHNDDTPSLDIPEPTLRSLLECCTKEAPFTCPRGNKYQQVDGVAMGSTLGVLLANFFMGCIEEEAFKTTKRPAIYCRYIDDIFIKTTSTEDAEHLRRLHQELSGLNFTIEHSTNGSMPFLDILVKQDQDAFNTAVYVKATNPCLCLNGGSECPKRYKDSTIVAYIRRALTHC